MPSSGSPTSSRPSRSRSPELGGDCACRSCCRGRPRIRLHQRIPRRGERHRDVRLHPSLTPRAALAMAAVFNLLGAMLGTAVAKTIASDIIHISDTSKHAGLVIVLSALIGAITWNLITWWLGLPSSSTHALIGGLAGVGVASGITVKWDAIIDKVVIPMVVSPLIGFVVAFLLMVAVLWIFRRASPSRAFRRFRLAQT